MSDILDRLYAAKAAALVAEEAREPLAQVVERGLRRRAERRPFSAALRAARGPAIVAEIKRASPSVGLIARNFDAAVVASTYELAGADAISVLTEADHFLGELAYLDVARAHSTRPILRKDFLSTPYQIAQSAAYGADAVLLIVAGLDDATLAQLCAEAQRFDLETLVEVHDEEELQRALELDASAIGINNRDLRTFETDLGVSEHLLPSIPSGTLVISESGVHDASDIARLHARGARGFLIGEALMRADDPAGLVAELKGAVTSERGA
ncbi:MAG TPA: indole-3-glycerol phosphate synthase TrpC [Candidatus Baltobacteraceae bacterium]|nr:indole-3-glycerol phosphate synthase TrpC [Candidatus Baltobacteraceae bacterium]